jgi:hypothetical protein
MNVFEQRGFRIFDIETKKVVLEGPTNKTANFLGVTPQHVNYIVKHKSRVTRNGKIYTVRFASTKTA